MVHRRTELEELVARHGTKGQAAFFLSTRGRSMEELEERHHANQRAFDAVAASVPVDWRSGRVERADLDRFLFAPDDVVVVVGQDGLVANVAKYLDGQPVIGIDPEPHRNPGVLVAHQAADAAELLRTLSIAEHRAMVAATTDDGQRLLALNEVYVGQPTHQTARYAIRPPGGTRERQASSGLIVATGTGSTGWCRSAWLERQSHLVLPSPDERRLLWFVREAWPSPATGTELTQGELSDADLNIDIESDGLVAFGDGMEDDRLVLTWGQTLTVGLAQQTLRMVG
ncbi:MAG: NAD(+)/NADH kinase [Nocardioidaceae bacterium]|nr:NAD(+)/NADH kinase [Nocardioidaceae bacterium]